MNSILGDLGRGLLDRWLAALTPPALAFGGVVLAAGLLGQHHALDLRLLVPEAVSWTRHDTAVMALSLLALLTLGFLVESVSTAVRHLWLGDLPSVLRPVGHRLRKRLRSRWDAADTALSTARDANPEPRTPEQQAQLNRLAARRAALGTSRPERGTWMGSRLDALHVRVFHEYGIDLAACWPRLWLVLPDSARTEVTSARRRFDAAAVLTTWAVPYAAAGIRWWPALPLALGLAWVGWRRGRTATATYADVVEAVVDVHCRDLAVATGVPLPSQRVTPAEGRALTFIARKGS